MFTSSNEVFTVFMLAGTEISSQACPSIYSEQSGWGTPPSTNQPLFGSVSIAQDLGYTSKLESSPNLRNSENGQVSIVHVIAIDGIPRKQSV